MTQLSQKDFHLLALAGGGKNLAQPASPEDRDHVIYNLEHLEGDTVLTCIDFRFWKMFLLSSELEEVLDSQPNTVVLTNHHDCGAYGGFSVFENDKDKEFEFQKNQLLKATKYVCDNEEACQETLATLFVDEEYNTLPEDHACEAIVLSCCESPYWQRAFEATQTKLGIGKFDILTSLGGPSMIARPEKEGYRDHLLENLKISKKLHEVPKGIVLVGHEGGSCKARKDDLEKARGIVQGVEVLRDVPVQTIWLD